MSIRLTVTGAAAGAVGAIVLSGALAGSAVADRIVFSRATNQKPGGIGRPFLWTIQSNGKRLRRLKTRANVGAADQSRDGRKLVWINSSATRVVVGNRKAARARVVYKKGGNSAPAGPRWSPSGGALAFGLPYRGNGIGRLGVLDLRSRQVRTFEGIQLGGWAPDGRTIVGSSSAAGEVACPHPEQQPPCFGRLPSLNTLDTQTGNVTTIRTWPNGSPPEATWSPDGRLIAFSMTPTDTDQAGGIYQIWTVQPDGSGLQQVTRLGRGAAYPSWSPDGRRLAFLAAGAGGKNHLATIGLNGAGLKRLTRDEYHLSPPDWGP